MIVGPQENNGSFTPIPAPAQEKKPHYVLIGVGAVLVIVVIIGVVIVGSSTTVDVTSRATVPTWGSEGADFSNNSPFSPQTGRGIPIGISEDELFQHLAGGNVQNKADIQIPTNTKTAQPTITDGVYTYDDANLLDLIQSISASAYISPTTRGGDEGDIFQSTSPLSDIYSFLPSGLMSTSTLIRNETTEQRKLREYANRAGIEVETFNDAWGPRQSAALKKFIEDRGDELKKEEVLDLARALTNVGRELASLDNVPVQVQSAHTKLAAQYQAVGARTKAVAEAETEDAFLSAVLASNTDADALAKAYIDIVETMSAYNVPFENNEAGRVFAFSAL